MKAQLYILSIIILAVGCTDSHNIELKTENNTLSILADGESTLELIGELDWEPTTIDQKIKFSTSAGKLYRYPILTFADSAGASQQTVNVEDTLGRVVLVPGTEAIEEVFLHVQANRTTDSEVIEFKHACPDTILLGGSDIEKIFFLSQGTKINLPVKLKRERGKVSDNTHLELSMMGGGDTVQVSYQSVLEVGHEEITTPVEMKSNSTIGEFTLQVMVNQKGCPSIKTSQTFEVKE